MVPWSPRPLSCPSTPHPPFFLQRRGPSRTQPRFQRNLTLSSANSVSTPVSFQLPGPGAPDPKPSWAPQDVTRAPPTEGSPHGIRGGGSARTAEDARGPGAISPISGRHPLPVGPRATERPPCCDITTSCRRETGHRGSGAPPRLHGQQTVEQIDSSSGVPLNHPPPCLAEKAIYRFLEGAGPCKALIIARALGMKTTKEVNPDLYDMRNRHLLSLDEKSSLWSIYRPGRSLPAAPR